MIQGGDPTGTGRGGESIYGCVRSVGKFVRRKASNKGLRLYNRMCFVYACLTSWFDVPSFVDESHRGKFEDEITRDLKHTGAGIVSMVRVSSSYVLLLA